MKKVKVDTSKEPAESVEPVENAAAPQEETSPEVVENPAEVSVEASATSMSAPEADDNATVITELTSDLQRTRADFENFRKQVEIQKSQAMSAAKYATVTKFLPLVDDFERALQTYPEQLAPLKKSFEKTLKSLGLSRIDSTEGAEFNPDIHEAISVEDEGGETEVISETLRPGYLYDGAVIRAAMVKVKRV